MINNQRNLVYKEKTSKNLSLLLTMDIIILILVYAVMGTHVGKYE